MRKNTVNMTLLDYLLLPILRHLRKFLSHFSSNEKKENIFLGTTFGLSTVSNLNFLESVAKNLYFAIFFVIWCDLMNSALSLSSCLDGYFAPNSFYCDFFHSAKFSCFSQPYEGDAYVSKIYT